jgi:hypothetical protein
VLDTGHVTPLMHGTVSQLSLGASSHSVKFAKKQQCGGPAPAGVGGGAGAGGAGAGILGIGNGWKGRYSSALQFDILCGGPPQQQCSP